MGGSLVGIEKKLTGLLLLIIFVNVLASEITVNLSIKQSVSIFIK
jgi:hypothetical protein